MNGADTANINGNSRPARPPRSTSRSSNIGQSNSSQTLKPSSSAGSIEGMTNAAATPPDMKRRASGGPAFGVSSPRLSPIPMPVERRASTPGLNSPTKPNNGTPSTAKGKQRQTEEDASTNGLTRSYAASDLSHSTSSTGSASSRFSRIPIAAVAMGRALSANNHDLSRSRSKSPYPEEEQDRFDIPPPNIPLPAIPNRSSSRASNTSRSSKSSVSSIPRRSTTPSSAPMHASRSLGGGVFYGGGTDHGSRHADRVKSAASGTGKVVSDLQLALQDSKGALETTKNQLRISQRAVEHLSRQVGDLSDAKERARLENEGLNKILVRKERMLEETLARARASESMHANLKHQIAEHGKRNKELEVTTDEAVLGKMKAESEYESIKSGMGSVSRWMKKEMEDLRGVLAEIQRQHGAEVLETRGKHQAIMALHSTRQAAQSECTLQLEQLTQIQSTYATESRSTFNNLSKQINEQEAINKTGLVQAQQVADDLMRMRRLMRNHQAESKQEATV